jgi:hypothetical protein
MQRGGQECMEAGCISTPPRIAVTERSAEFIFFSQPRTLKQNDYNEYNSALEIIRNPEGNECRSLPGFQISAE